VVPIITKGDRTLDKPLPQIGGKGLFTFELESALLQDEIDLVVHSLKDLPTEQSTGLIVAAIPERGSVEDVIVLRDGLRFDLLNSQTRIGTSSLRRQSQLRKLMPGLNPVSVRGNVPTRIGKVLDGAYDGVVLAAAGIERLQLTHFITQRFSVDQIMPAPGQGALAVQCRDEDTDLKLLLDTIDDSNSSKSVQAERSFLKSLGGGCSAPVGAYATVDHGKIWLRGLISSLDGGESIRVEAVGTDPTELGIYLAEQAIREGADRLMHLTRMGSI
jgi:hydroxymethylbilane synthase